MSPDSTSPGNIQIGDGVKLIGKLELSGVASVDGHVEGEIVAKELRVGPAGRIVGSVTAEHADVHGQIEKDLTVTDTLILRSSCKVRGTIVYEVIEIEQGASVEGSFKRVPAEKRAKTSPAKSMIPLLGSAATESSESKPADPALGA